MSLRIVFSSGDVRMLDCCLGEVIDVLKKTQVAFTGPIPLPTRLIRFRSSSGGVVHRRLIDLDVAKSPESIEKFNIPIGVSVDMKYVM